jgi:hypothetical protein
MSIVVAVPSGGVQELSQVDVSRLVLGTEIAALITGDIYRLEESDAAVNHDTVEAAKDVGTYRWIKQTGAEGPALNGGVRIWFGPEGDDANDGTDEFSAMKTGYAAYAKLLSAGGGELHFFDEAEWGGPVSGQGMWLRGDGREIAGWQTVCTFNLIGHGGAKTQFGRAAARLAGGIPATSGSADRFHPLLWLCSNAIHPVGVYNVSPMGCTQMGRYGWDFRRNESDSSIAFADITNWDRVDGEATVTVELPTGITITSASRTSNVTKLNFAAQTRFIGSVGLWIHVTSSDPNFASGDYQITDVQSGTVPTWIKYEEVDADASGGAIGTWETHGLKQYDRVEVVATDGISGEVPSTAYRVLSVTDATHFVVTDTYGYAPRTTNVSVNDVGQYVLQDRGAITGLLTFDNVGGSVSPSVSADGFIPGPTQDFGGTSDGRIVFRYSSNTGYGPSITGCTDPDRECWALLDGGSKDSAAGTFLNCDNGFAGIRIYGSKTASWSIIARDVNSDAAVGGTSPPAVHVLEGGGSAPLKSEIKNCIVWDNPSGTPNVIVSGTSNIPVENCGQVEVDGSIVNTGDWNARSESAIDLRQYGQWAAHRTSADSPQPRRAGGPVNCRYQNWLSMDTATWTVPGGVTATEGEPDMFGGTNAVTLDNGGALTGVYLLPQDVNNNPHTAAPVVHAAGDRWVFGGWFRRPNGLGAETVLASFSMVGANGDFGVALRNDPFNGQGEWVWIVNWATIETITDANVGWRCTVSSYPGEMGFDSLFLTRVPAGEIEDDNEFAEWAHSLQSTPYEAAAGILTTRPGQVLVARGGTGIDSSITKTVGVGSGQLTLTGSGTIYEPVYDSDGTTVIGWRELLQATVNP